MRIDMQDKDQRLQTTQQQVKDQSLPKEHTSSMISNKYQ